MNKVVLALASFVVGACSALSVSSLTHASTRVQEQQPPPPRRGMVIAGAEPVVGPIRYFGHGDTIAGDVQALDSMSCEGCIIRASVLTYAGGQVSLSHCDVPNNVPIVFTGAANNTLKFMQSLGLIPTPQPKAQPKMQMAGLEIKSQNSFTLIDLSESK